LVASLISLMILIASPNSPDLAPNSPARFPAMLKSWHGLPKVIMSTGSIPLPRTCVTSPKCFIFGKCRLVIAIGASSISLAQAASIPCHEATSKKPPMPSNKEPIFNFLMLIPPFGVPQQPFAPLAEFGDFQQFDRIQRLASILKLLPVLRG